MPVASINQEEESFRVGEDKKQRNDEEKKNSFSTAELMEIEIKLKQIERKKYLLESFSRGVSQQKKEMEKIIKEKVNQH